MTDSSIKVHKRFTNSFQNFTRENLLSREFLSLSLTWLVSAILLLAFFDFSESPYLSIALALIQIYALFRLAPYIFEVLAPPVELLVLLFFGIFLLEVPILREVISSGSPGVLTSLHILLMSLQILLFSLILIRSSEGKKRGVVLYAFLAGVSVYLFADAHAIPIFLFQVFLFFSLIRRTQWLEELTVVECWAYIFFMLFLATQFYGFRDVFAENPATGLSYLWFEIPHYLYLLFLLYLFACLAKLPIVIAYNHARLSRKLWVAGLFQSTFPQIIQTSMLLLIFYFLIAGWQAENVRQGFINELESMKRGDSEEKLEYLAYKSYRIGETVNIRGYYPFQIPSNLPEHGIVAFERIRAPKYDEPDARQYYLFLRSNAEAGRAVYLIKLTSQFVELISSNTPVLAGSALQGYRHEPSQWETFLYQKTYLSVDQGITLYPFAVVPTENETFTAGAIRNRYSADYNDPDSRAPGRLKIVVGRLVTPLYNTDFREIGYYNFDVLFISDANFLASPIVRNLAYLLGLYLLINFLVTVSAIRFGDEIKQTIIRKFQQLQAGIREIASGNLNYKVQLEGQDEIVELGQHFNFMSDRLKKNIKETREKDRLEHEMAIAQQVQQSLVPPPTNLPNVEGFQVASAIKTATEVGGDFYDIMPLGNHKFLFTIGDVSGKSTSAAFYMAQCISLIRFSPQFTEDPREITLRLNQYFADPLVDKQMFVTAIVGLLDAHKNTIKYVRAGHTPPIFVPNDPEKELKELTTPGLGVGLARGTSMLENVLKTDSVKMAVGDMIVFYTDGVVEANDSESKVRKRTQNEEERFYGEERLNEVINSVRGKDAIEVVRAITRDLEGFYGDAPLADDYTLLVIKRRNS